MIKAKNRWTEEYFTGPPTTKMIAFVVLLFCFTEQQKMSVAVKCVVSNKLLTENAFVTGLNFIQREKV